MRNLLLLLTIFAFQFSVRAQFYQGLRASAFGGVTNINYNPAIADNRFLVDINLIGLGVNFSNNYVGITKDVFKKNSAVFNSNDDFQKAFLNERVNGRDKNVYVGMQIQGPLSFMCSFGLPGEDKNTNAFGFSYHVNSIVNGSRFNETFARIAYLGVGYTADSILAFRGKSLTDINPSAKAMMWADYGLTYSRVVYNKEEHFIKAGGTLKLLQGIAGGYAYVKNLNYRWETFDTLSIFKAEAQYAYSEGMVSSKGYSADNINNYISDLFKFKYAAPSVAVDLGVIYEWRPDKDNPERKYKYRMNCEDHWYLQKNKYKLSAGFSLVDFGAIRYRKGEYSGNFTADIQNWDVGGLKFTDGLQSVDDTIASRFVINKADKGYFTMWLPTRFNMFLDYNIAYGFGLNLATSISPNMAPNRNMVHHGSSITFTPRYDHAWFGFYLPVSTDFKGNVNMGATMRVGPLIIGTQDLLGFFAKKFVYNADIHVALKITIPYWKPRDRDKDEVSNKADKCKKVKGDCTTQGCPDRDKDGTTDDEDDCPDTPGPKELKGCPDTDGDGLIDKKDSCVNEYGLIEFYGCPDRDSDRIPDRLDECPDIPGIVEFNGCPDRDKDGTPDKDDRCIDVPGPKEHFGCPDTDGDGLYDYEDKCINTPGPKENDGCPWPDRDNDGVLDKDDQCPSVPGVVENKGCPALTQKEIETVKYAFENLEFETGKDIIRSSSFPSLNALAQLLVKKPTYGLRIEGHTDNVGTDENNLLLSQKRATAVKKFLVKKGVKETVLEDYGYGESKPIADNDTKEGKQKNRRVEMKITFK